MSGYEAPTFEAVIYFPENFFDKSVNEPFIQMVMEFVLERTNWRHGNADSSEPDYFCDEVPFEFTIASDRKKKGNFIQRLQVQSMAYTSDDIEKDICQYIQTSIEKKLEKNYAVKNVHLCVLCTMNLTCWVPEEHRSNFYCIVGGSERKNLFQWIKDNCIKTGKFSNVFVIFPSMNAKWWVWDVATNHKGHIQLSEEVLATKLFPFCVDKDSYDEIKHILEESNN